MGRELELKFRAEETQIAAIFRDYTGFQDISMETVYYDTPKRLLGERRVTLRRRYENGTAVYALKTYLPDGSHGEWETEAPSLEQALSLLQKLGAPDLPAVCDLEEICGARFTRSCVTLSIPGGKAELAVDRGSLLGGGRELPLSEVELELKAGDDGSLYAFGEAFARRYGLEEEPLSKFARARTLARNG